MNNLLDNVEEEDAGGRRDREITLGTTTVLGIFFGLAILCAAFFGFGYSMGSKHTAVAVTPNGDPVSSHSFSGVKPSPGSPLAANPTGKASSVDTTYTSSDAGSPPKPAAAAPGTAAPVEAFEPDLPTVTRTVKTAAPAAAPAVAATSPTATGQQFVVQVAALSHQEDAELIVTTLERRGYVVAIRPDAGDHLLHVQVGPFANHKDAEAMRQKLLGDGFNAYIK